MFKKEDVGRTVKIMNTRSADWLKRGGEYKITKFINSKCVLFEGTNGVWIGAEPDDIIFMNRDNKKNSFNIGDNVILTHNTTSLEKGNKAKIIAFLNNDPSKPVINGVIPGGWINPNKLTKQIDLSQHRIKKAIELFEEFGAAYLSIFGLSKKSNYYNKTLEEIGCIQEGSTILKPGEAHIDGGLFTNKTYDPIIIIIIDGKYICSQITGKEQANFNGKVLKEILPGFNEEDDEYISNICMKLLKNNDSFLQNSYIIHKRALQFIKLKDYEKQVPVLPFT